MYIMKCDRCGKEQPIKTMLAFFGGEEDPRAALKYSITLRQDDGVREITLCQDCEAALEKWLKDYTREVEPRCDNCKYGKLHPGIEPCKSCDHKSNWEATGKHE